jgi:Na+-driven multidrug efflux pump
MVRLGTPVAIQMGVMSLGNGAMFRLVNSFEATNPGIIAAYGAAIRLDMLAFVPIQSFGMGLASFTGQNIGAGRLDRVKRGLAFSIMMSLTIVLLMSVFLNVFAYQLIAFFGLTDASMGYGVEMIRFLTFFFWIFACNMTMNGLLQGSGDTITASMGTMSALTTRILVGYSAVHFGLLGYNAAWISVPIGWGVASIIILTRFLRGGWKKKAVAGSFAKQDNKE